MRWRILIFGMLLFLLATEAKRERRFKLLTNPKTMVLVGQSQTGKSTFINDMAGKYLAPTGTGEESITAKVSMYNFKTMNQDFIVLDTPGLSDTRGNDGITDEKIKDQIEKAILQIGEMSKNTINAFLIFENCGERMIRINTTFREMEDMFGNEYA